MVQAAEEVIRKLISQENSPNPLCAPVFPLLDPLKHPPNLDLQNLVVLKLHWSGSHPSAQRAKPMTFTDFSLVPKSSR